MGRERRIHHPGIRGDEDEVVLSPEASRHLERVLRLGPGAEVSVFDGAGREWNAEIVGTGAPGTRLRLGAERSDPVEPTLRVVLHQGLCRHDRMELLIQKGTEIGLAAILGVPAGRSEPGRVGPGRLERWRRIAAEAARQSGRRVIPAIDVAVGFPEMAGSCIGFLLHPAPGVPPLAARLSGAAPAEVHLGVGPEGGLTDAEAGELEDRGWLAAGLGPRTLRTETAGLVAAVLVLSRWGDLGRSGPDVVRATSPVD